MHWSSERRCFVQKVLESPAIWSPYNVHYFKKLAEILLLSYFFFVCWHLSTGITPSISCLAVPSMVFSFALWFIRDSTKIILTKWSEVAFSSIFSFCFFSFMNYEKYSLPWRLSKKIDLNFTIQSFLQILLQSFLQIFNTFCDWKFSVKNRLKKKMNENIA